MQTIIMTILFLCPSVSAQLAPADNELRNRISEKSSNVEHMIGAFAAGLAKDDLPTLRKKHEALTSMRKSMDEGTVLRMEMIEELFRLQIGLQSMGRPYSNDDSYLEARLDALEKIEAALSGLVDKTELKGIREKQESGKAKGMLSSIRSAVQVYYGDTEGTFPTNLSVLTDHSKYLSYFPAVTLPGHKKQSNAVKYVSGVRDMNELAEKVDDAGGWLYVNDKTSPMWGTVVLNCRHHDGGDENKPLMYTY